MSASKSPYEPRHEAEVVAWHDLTEDQRAAVEGAHGYFSRMAEIADEAKKRDASGLAELDIFLPHIDEQRRNHVILIDGERGTGKTAVTSASAFATIIHQGGCTRRRNGTRVGQCGRSIDICDVRCGRIRIFTRDVIAIRH